MSKTGKILLIIPLMTFALYGTAPGEKAPAILMKTSAGAVCNPGKQGREKPLILSFFSHTCQPCMMEVPELQALEGRGADIALVADAGTDERAAAVFFEKIRKTTGTKITLPVVYDRYGDIKKSFGVTSFPTLFLIRKDATIGLRFTGFKPENMDELKKSLN